MTVAGLGYAIQHIRQHARAPDTELAHISPDEIKLFDAIQGRKVRNPRTGLPEYGLLGEILQMALGVGGFMIGGPLGAAAGSGLGAAINGGNLKQSLLAAALGGAGGELGQGLTDGGWNPIGGALGKSLGFGADAAAGAAGAGAPSIGASPGFFSGVQNAALAPPNPFGFANAAAPSAVAMAPTSYAGNAVAAAAAPQSGLGGLVSHIGGYGGLGSAAGALYGMPQPTYAQLANPQDSFRIGPVSPMHRTVTPYPGDPLTYGQTGGEWQYFNPTNPQAQSGYGMAHGGQPKRMADGGSSGSNQWSDWVSQMSNMYANHGIWPGNYQAPQMAAPQAAPVSSPASVAPASAPTAPPASQSASPSIDLNQFSANSNSVAANFSPSTTPSASPPPNPLLTNPSQVSAASSGPPPAISSPTTAPNASTVPTTGTQPPPATSAAPNAAPSAPYTPAPNYGVYDSNYNPGGVPNTYDSNYNPGGTAPPATTAPPAATAPAYVSSPSPSIAYSGSQTYGGAPLPSVIADTQWNAYDPTTQAALTAQGYNHGATASMVSGPGAAYPGQSLALTSPGYDLGPLAFNGPPATTTPASTPPPALAQPPQHPAPTQQTTATQPPPQFDYSQFAAQHGGVIGLPYAHGGVVHRAKGGNMLMQNMLPLHRLRALSHQGYSEMMAKGGSTHEGSVHGPGTGQSDSVPAMLSTGEHVWSAKDVAALGSGSNEEGQRRLYRLRKMINDYAGYKPSERLKAPRKMPSDTKLMKMARAS